MSRYFELIKFFAVCLASGARRTVFHFSCCMPKDDFSEGMTCIIHFAGLALEVGSPENKNKGMCRNIY